MFESMDKQEVTLLVMFDLSAAFNTVSHAILFNTSQTQFGISGTVLSWLKSYLSNRKQLILIGNDTLSDDFSLGYGVQQGSCLGPVLFVLYINSSVAAITHREKWGVSRWRNPKFATPVQGGVYEKLWR